MAVTRRQAAKKTSTDAATCAITWATDGGTGSTLTNSMLVAVVCVADTFGANPGGITPPTGWLQATFKLDQDGLSRTYIFYKTHAAAQSATGNFSSDDPDTDWVVLVAEYTGWASSSVLDKTKEALGASSAGSTGTTTTTAAAAELLIGALTCDDGSITFSLPTNSFSIVNQANTGSTVAGAMLDRVVSSTGTYTTGATLSGSSSWGGAIATFMAFSLGPTDNAPIILMQL